MRIVSLLPSATEIVCALGLHEQLVGVTHECDFPPPVKRLPKVTRTRIPVDATSAAIDRRVDARLEAERGLYSLDREMLRSLRPDLIVTQTLCHVCAVPGAEVRAAADALPSGAAIVNLEPETLTGVFAAIRQVAAAADAVQVAERLVEGLMRRVDTVVERSGRVESRPPTTLLEWLDPPFSCGHWNPELVRLAGGREALGAEGLPSRRLDWADVIRAQPEVICVACCGFTIERTLPDLGQARAAPGWSKLPAVRSGRVYVTDGSQYFSRPGPRLVDSLEILAHALHPDTHPLPVHLAGELV
ncbi:cobalamin-binding protein [soil metagenome]